MLSPVTINTTLAELSNLNTSQNETQFMDQAVQLLCLHLGFHFVGLYLVDNQTIVLKSGSGELGKLLLARNHQFQVTGDSLASRVISTGKIWAVETKYEKPQWSYKTYKSVLPLEVERNSHLVFELIEETQSVNEAFTSPVYPTPPGWEICLPLRVPKRVFGTLTIHAWELSEFREEARGRWAYLLAGGAEEIKSAGFDKEYLSELQWLVEQLSTMISRSTWRGV